MTAQTTSIDNEAVERHLIAWVERTLGVQVKSVERQNRWRPAWFLEIAGSPAVEQLYVRGERTTKSVMFPLEYEFRVLQILEANGILVPHVYGMCPDPMAIVMSKAPGRADLSTAANDDVRCSVMDHYIDQLAAIHAIDASAFEAVGLERPVGPTAIALEFFEQYVELYRESKRRPEPLLEFFINWVRRSVPKNRNRVSLVCADPAQFLFQNDRVTALLDFELAYLGDPMHDLAGLLLRDLNEPLGDLGRALRRYSELTGEQIDEEAFDFHTIRWAACTPLSMADNVSRPLPMGDILQYMEWFVHVGRISLEVMARRLRIPLSPRPTPVARPAWLGIASEALVGAVRGLAASDAFAAYQRDSAAKLAMYLHHAGEIGPELERQDIQDVNELVGGKFETWQQADAALEQFILRAGPECDRDLIPLLYRRTQRQQALLEPVLSRPCVALSTKSLPELLNGG